MCNKDKMCQLMLSNILIEKSYFQSYTVLAVTTVAFLAIIFAISESSAEPQRSNRFNQRVNQFGPPPPPPGRRQNNNRNNNRQNRQFNNNNNNRRPAPRPAARPGICHLKKVFRF